MYINNVIPDVIMLEAGDFSGETKKLKITKSEYSKNLKNWYSKFGFNQMEMRDIGKNDYGVYDAMESDNTSYEKVIKNYMVKYRKELGE